MFHSMYSNSSHGWLERLLPAMDGGLEVVCVNYESTCMEHLEFLKYEVRTRYDMRLYACWQGVPPYRCFEPSYHNISFFSYFFHHNLGMRGYHYAV